MQRIFRFRSCTLAIDPEDPANAHFRPCLLHAIGQCSAPCANRITPQAYRRDIDRVVRFMSSGRTTVLRELTQEMEEASGEREYERAGVLRDQIEAIKKLDERPDDKTSEPDWQPEVTNPRIDWEESMRSLQRALSIQTPIRCVEGFDVAHLDGQETVASKVCFIDGRPFRDAYRRYRIQMATNDDYMALREVVSRRYRRVSEGLEIFPDLVLIDGGRGQLNAAMAAFGLLGIEPPLIVSLAKKEEEVYRPGSSEPLRLGRSNPGLRLLQAVRDEAHRFAQHYHHILRKKRFLDQ
jgi:excinuclease ABC subunit C